MKCFGNGSKPFRFSGSSFITLPKESKHFSGNEKKNKNNKTVNNMDRKKYEYLFIPRNSGKLSEKYKKYICIFIKIIINIFFAFYLHFGLRMKIPRICMHRISHMSREKKYIVSAPVTFESKGSSKLN